GGGEETGGQEVDDAPVRLLREGSAQIAGAQPGLDVADADAAVEGGEGGGHGGGGVPLDEEPVGGFGGEHLVHGGDRRRGEAVQRLVVAHQPQVEVGAQSEQILCLVEHLPVLAGGADAHGDLVRTALE